MDGVASVAFVDDDGDLHLVVAENLDEGSKRREVVEVLRAQRRGRLRAGGMSKGIATAILAASLVLITALSSGAVEGLRDLLCSSVCGNGHAGRGGGSDDFEELPAPGLMPPPATGDARPGGEASSGPPEDAGVEEPLKHQDRAPAGRMPDTRVSAGPTPPGSGGGTPAPGVPTSSPSSEPSPEVPPPAADGPSPTASLSPSGGLGQPVVSQAAE
ncbi:hypothetical protein [Actinomadura violacea]|uniref:Uncharacterized protein n=1 Tax=Actinomadura violacea TaxID=2819934 RepID=A0ABS3S630_9ACTN|nr:hypothetical protein [Actinomadura violacea]MBO2464460.1 hypothetical protein [Actinomadura violacea]